MHFKHPEILYALLLLAIPIIVHLFQLRRFKKVSFTNVALLKSVTLQTRKSAIIKKWLTLITRLLLLTAIILAFAQPYTSNKTTYKTKKETVIYLDNSFSMQAKGNNGTLLQEAVNDLISTFENSSEFTLITNNQTFKNTTIAAIKNELLLLKPTTVQLNYNAALLQAKRQFSKHGNSLKNLIAISDFQQNGETLNVAELKDITTHLVKLQPKSRNNISVDSLFISKTTTENLELTVILKNQGDAINDVTISLFNDDVLLAKSAVDITKETATVFTIPNNSVINGLISVSDTQLQFDNTLFFNINKPSKINVLTINDTDDEYLRKVYNDSEFNYQSVSFNQLNYNTIDNQNLIILNELKSIPNSLSIALNTFKKAGGYILIIPKDNTNLNTYNQLFINFSEISFSSFIKQEKRITKINFSHPLFKDVFNNKVTNFQYPKVNSFFTVSSSETAIINYEDNQPFLMELNGVFVFTSALNNTNSNFQNSPLIVPTLYNIGKQSLQLPKLYYVVGKENIIDIKTSLKQDEILSLVNNETTVIPEQQTFSNKVNITTSETPEIAGIYNIIKDKTILENISYNYNRDESNLQYIDLLNIASVTIDNSVLNVINKIKSSLKINTLWKWFVIFALLMLIIEMLILKFFK